MLAFCAKRTGDVTVTVYDQNCDKVETLSVSHGLRNLLLFSLSEYKPVFVKAAPHLISSWEIVYR